MQPQKQKQTDFKSRGIRGARAALQSAGFNTFNSNYSKTQRGKTMLSFLTKNYVKRKINKPPTPTQVLLASQKKSDSFAWSMIPGALWDVNTRQWNPPDNMIVKKHQLK